MATPELEAAGTAAPDNGRPPRDDLLRATTIEYRAGAGTGNAPQLYGHFAVFNTWTEIGSMWEGRFIERFMPGAFKKTIRENGDRMRVLFQHGMDPAIGDRPIAAITDLREDAIGAYYEADLLDGVPDLITAGLRADQYGASFRFSVMREEWVEEPGMSDYNPDGLPERTIKEVRVAEFGPVTFGAYQDASAALRSTTDSYLILRSADPDARRRLLARTPATKPQPPDPQTLRDRLAEIDRERAGIVDILEQAATERADEPAPQEPQDAPSEGDAGTESHLTDERREDKPPASQRRPIYGTRRKETSKPWLLGPSKSTKRS